MKFFKEDGNGSEELNELRRQDMIAIGEELGVGTGFEDFDAYQSWHVDDVYERKGNEIWLKCQRSFSWDVNLVLENISCDTPIEELVWDPYDYWEAGSCDGRYYIDYRVLWEEEAGREYRIYFTSARIEKQIYDATEVQLGCDAITHLVSVADEIRRQAEQIGDSACAYQEEELARLVEFFCGLEFWTEQKISREAVAFFREFVKGYDLNRLSHLVEMLAAELSQEGETRDKQYRKVVTRICQELNRAEYEPLWRAVYQRFSKSQEGYPSKTECLCDRILLQENRARIDRTMREQGFEGQYPEYRKKDQIKGFHVVGNFGQTYIVGIEKVATYLVYFQESYDECLTYSILCGYVTGKDPAYEQADGYTLLFDAKGKRYCKQMTARVWDGEEQDDKEPTIEDYARVAIKRATLKKLTRKERNDWHYMGGEAGIVFYLYLFLFCGIFFGVFWTLAMMAISGVLSLVVLRSFSQMFLVMKEVPWLQIGLAAGGLFGAGMTIAMRTANRK